MSLPREAGRLLCVLVLLLALPGVAEEPGTPSGLVVERDGTLYRGRWTAVSGASYYEVWVKNFGRWTYNPNTLETSPFTSSFSIRVEDDRARFKVRAVDSDGVKGRYSQEVAPTLKTADENSGSSGQATRTGGKSASDFDPEAPPPDPPSGLFTIWSEQDVIKLVWQDSKGAKSYAVEEFVNDKWISPAKIEFPKKTTAVIKGHPAPGPYKFRVRAVGKNGRASEPSRETTAKR